ncbi:MAG TPA: hypothetical protein VJB60_03145 [Candidatus Peribacterales bacterium]|nr:hypothetical protein [Candidatus Peribacterales bacterium]
MIVPATIGMTFLVYAYLKRANLTLTAGDQWVYFYASHLFAEGSIPYRDFFFSHAPLQILLSTLLVKMGVGLIGLNLLPAIIGGFSGIILFVMVKRSAGVERTALALIFFLLSYANLMSTLYYTGQELGLFLFLVGMLLFLKRKKGWAGFLIGLSACASINMIVNAAVLTIIQLRWNKRSFIPFFAALSGGFAAIQLLFFGIAGKAYFTQVYLYHLLKPDHTTRLASNTKVFWMMTHAHGLLLLLAICGLILFFLERRKETEGAEERHKLLTVSSSLAGAQILFLMIIHPIFPHYFVPIAPFLAILAAEAVIAGWKILQKWISGRNYPLAFITPIASILLLTGALWHTLKLYRMEGIVLGIPEIEEVAEAVKSSIGPDATIFGEFGTTPLISLLSDRRIAGNVVDSSVMRIMGGQITLKEMIDQIERDNVQMIVGRGLKDINAYPPFWKYRDAHFTLVRSFKAKGHPAVIELWRRK